ncbi:two component transcriptional regulator, LytTR family [Emticicia oligotrophica DSM 17448]|uniref:Two component transcriptional regulator, LytTR family n=1 Tax=Emticicia oligotrophica (strain DSM 17448 / CIP 109782 / MTCC 6937 / GPTSA100-15) TaxID=929562 RepID=A0ABM5N225_EMTOG|nr:LytTR family DNA-binding domain-containing protein [Emticicia oligotrophica]AFK03507.1 two component transcriptional regulator, LytTR family [Emticicia oligotrophica DSM 17448]
MLKAIAIDDEPMALEVIKAHAKKVTFLDLKETFVSATEALTYLKESPIDLVFLDINMPDVTGLDFSQLLPQDTSVIFTTAYSQYAVDAFNLNALDYLLKPIDFSRFMKACQKAYENTNDETPKVPYLFVKDGYDLVRVSIDDLHFVESEGNYLTFKESDKKTVTRMTMTEAIEMLPKSDFFRVHKSYIINLNHVKKIERHQVWVGNDPVPIAANYREELMEILKRIWMVK